MRRLIVAGNWKMFGSKASIKSLIELMLPTLSDDRAETIVFPPYVYLEYVATLIRGSKINLGAQNLNENNEGAYTGEISPSMLKDNDCHYVLVGHSERRTLFNESNEVVAKKYQAAIAAGLKPILCVGETLAEREANRTEQVILGQLAAVMDLPAGLNLLSQGVLAYEPVWAIGTGKTATPEQAQEVHALLRNYVGKRDKSIADKLQILYGGSVKANNAAALFAMPDIDGGLVGGASLNAQEFLQITEAARK